MSPIRIYIYICTCVYETMKGKKRIKSPTPTIIEETVNIHKREEMKREAPV